MALSDTYASVKEKAQGDPWYTRWIWWLVGAGMFVFVFGLWWWAKKQEAKVKAAARIADDDATRAELMARAEKDIERAAEFRGDALTARRKAKELAAKVNETAEMRLKLEAAIKGSKDWTELNDLEDDIE